MNSSNEKPEQDAKKAPESTTTAAPKPPAQSQVDQERGDWEGMGQSRYQPDTDAPATPAVTPTPKH